MPRIYVPPPGVFLSVAEHNRCVNKSGAFLPLAPYSMHAPCPQGVPGFWGRGTQGCTWGPNRVALAESAPQHPPLTVSLPLPSFTTPLTTPPSITTLPLSTPSCTPRGVCDHSGRTIPAPLH